VPTVIAPPVTVAPANGNGHPAAEEKNEKGRRGAKARHETVGRTVHEKSGRKPQKARAAARPKARPARRKA
jgi:hypothetical protein